MRSWPGGVRQRFLGRRRQGPALGRLPRGGPRQKRATHEGGEAGRRHPPDVPRRPLCALTPSSPARVARGLHAAADLARRERDNSVRGLRVRGAPESGEGASKPVDGQAVVFAFGGRVRLRLPETPVRPSPYSSAHESCRYPAGGPLETWYLSRVRDRSRGGLSVCPAARSVRVLDRGRSRRTGVGALRPGAVR